MCFLNQLPQYTRNCRARVPKNPKPAFHWARHQCFFILQAGLKMLQLHVQFPAIRKQAMSRLRLRHPKAPHCQTRESDFEGSGRLPALGSLSLWISALWCKARS